jgi:hypothetical protein
MTTRALVPARGLVAALIAMAAPDLPLPAQESGDGSDPPVRIQRLQGPVELDGMPFEEAWSDIDPLPLTMYFPTFRGTPSERTEILVAYDDEHLYVAGRLYDSEPEGIRVNSLYRDRWAGDDAVAVYVDAFNDNRNARWFGTTPAGMRFDLLVSDDGATVNSSWDTFWDAESAITTEGWFTEIRIPFSTLGFQAPDGRAFMGLTVTRLVSRTGERVTFPAIDPRFEFRQPSVAQDVILEGVTSPTPLYVTPYALVGVERRPVPTDAGAGGERAFAMDRDVQAEVGLDVRYPVTGTLTLDVTARTDFAQVEADQEQINLDRFDLFFPEKRRFFQERSGLFEFATGRNSRLFHSRRIGLTAARRPVPVLGGARVVGRLGEWDVGLLDMQTEAFEETPSENFGVARVRRGILNPFSYVGTLVTTRLSGDAYNVAVGADGVLRLFGDDWLEVRWASTFDDGEEDREPPAPAGDVGLVDRSHLHARWRRRAIDGLAYDVEYTRSGRSYRPELGFLPRRDFSEANLLANWYHRTDDHPFLRRVWPGLLAFSTFRNANGSLESGQYAVWIQWETKGGGGGWIEPKLFVEDVLAPFAIDEHVAIPAGRYTFADLQVNVSMPSGRRLRTDLDVRAGTFFDGNRTQLVLEPTWNVSPHLEVGGSYRYTRLRFDERGQGTDIHLAGLEVRTALDTRLSANGLFQYNTTTDRFDANVRIRYRFAEGTDLWLVWDEGVFTGDASDPGLLGRPRSLSRTFIVKYTYTFSL